MHTIKPRRGEWNGGMGRPNFVGAWEKEKIEQVDYSYREREVTLIPYSSTPPFQLRFDETYRKYPRYGTLFKNKINEVLPGIWTLPPDWRLDWDFQHHVFCQKGLGQDKEGGLLELASQIRTQHKQFEFINGLYTVTEISSQGQYHL